MRQKVRIVRSGLRLALAAQRIQSDHASVTEQAIAVLALASRRVSDATSRCRQFRRRLLDSLRSGVRPTGGHRRMALLRLLNSQGLSWRDWLRLTGRPWRVADRRPLGP